MYYDTEGIGIRLAGFFKFIRHTEPMIASYPLLDFLTEHFDVQYSWSEWDTEEKNHPLDGTTFQALSIYFK